MARSFQQKLKILYLLRAFQEKTDEQHPMTVSDLIDYLEEFGITVERKTVYDDIETLRTFGLDIANRRSKPSGFYLASRDFELAELKLLADAVQSSKFITDKKSRQLIRKIARLASVYESKQIQRQVIVGNPVKNENESIYYNVDELHRGISMDRQVSFQYFEWTVSKEMRLKKDGARYLVSPWGLIWRDENYYLIGLDEKSGIVKHYRVDKMLRISVEKQPRNGREIFEGFDVGTFAARTFGMFGGREETLTLEFANHLIGVVLDRFGHKITVRKEDEQHFRIRVQVNVSGQFFGWLAGLGSDVTIVSPQSVQKDYLRFLQRAMENYRNG